MKVCFLWNHSSTGTCKLCDQIQTEVWCHPHVERFFWSLIPFIMCWIWYQLHICTLYVLCAIYDTYIILVHRVIRYNTKHRELRSQDSSLCSDTFLWHLLHTCALSTLSPPSGSGTWTRILLAELLLPLETSLEGRGAGGRLEGAVLGLGRWALPGLLAVDGRL